MDSEQPVLTCRNFYARGWRDSDEEAFSRHRKLYDGLRPLFGEVVA